MQTARVFTNGNSQAVRLPKQFRLSVDEVFIHKVAQTGDIYYGLWYPIVIAMVTVVIGAIFVPENKDKDIFADAR